MPVESCGHRHTRDHERNREIVKTHAQAPVVVVARPLEHHPSEGGVQIRITNLHKRFRRGRRAADVVATDDISLEVNGGEMLVLLGPSGCGKTTLLRCVAGLERPDSGAIEINRRVVYSSADGVFVPPMYRSGMSMMFQSYALWPHMTIRKNIAYPLQARGIRGAQANERIDDVLQLLDLQDQQHQYPGQCSGGQQQRAALARALVPQPGVVLFDEPLSNVDKKVRDKLRIDLRILQRSLKFSALYVTHDQDEAMELGDRVAVLERGRVAQVGTPEEVYRQPVSEYVATFVGTGNILGGLVSEVRDREAIVNSTLGEVVVDRSSDCPSEVREGAIIKVIVRPEEVRLLPTRPTEARNVWRGTVLNRVFMASRTRYLVQTGEFVWMVVIQSETTASSEGAQVWLDVPPSALRVIG